MTEDIRIYNDNQPDVERRVCELLAKEITANLPDATCKVWHGAPVWFLDGNPIAGYAVRKNDVQLLFWSGQSFDEPGLKPEGTFKAAEARYNTADDVNANDLRQWLKKSQTIQWDYKNIVKRKGVLERLT